MSTHRGSLYSQMSALHPGQSLVLEVANKAAGVAVQRQSSAASRWPPSMAGRIYATEQFVGVSIANTSISHFVKIVRLE